MSFAEIQTPFITFYSFKGGVGRSLALINTAALMAGRRGFRILVVDLDLEAPGLSYLPRNIEYPGVGTVGAAPGWVPGFLDLLADAKDRGLHADLFAKTPAEVRDAYTFPIEIPPALRDRNGGSIHLMPAGQHLSRGYADSLTRLDLAGLYRLGLGEPLIRAFKQSIAASGLFDYVLIDSRTGFSDEAGMCTRDLADHVVVVSGLNRQNVEGNTHFLCLLRRVADQNAPDDSRSSIKPSVSVILSPIPVGEDSLRYERQTEAEQSFRNAWGPDLDPFLEIPYHPALALADDPHVFRCPRGPLHDAYLAIERAILKCLHHTAAELRQHAFALLSDGNYTGALGVARRLIGLDEGQKELARLTFDIFNSKQPAPERAQLTALTSSPEGRAFLEFFVAALEVPEEPTDEEPMEV